MKVKIISFLMNWQKTRLWALNLAQELSLEFIIYIWIAFLFDHDFFFIEYWYILKLNLWWCKLINDYRLVWLFGKKIIPTRGVEPQSRGWKPRILTAERCRILIYSIIFNYIKIYLITIHKYKEHWKTLFSIDFMKKNLQTKLALKIGINWMLHT